jgi:hypothetical protein
VAFNSRFLMATKENVGELAKKYQDLFPAP